MTRCAPIFFGLVLTLSVVLAGDSAFANGCASCGMGGRSFGMYGHPAYVGQPYMYRGYVPRQLAPMMAAPYPQSPLPFPVHMVPRPGEVGAPRGTLGWTYRYPTRHMSRKLHPRASQLQINNVPIGMQVFVVDEGGDKVMSGHRSADGVWRFKANQPLMPGIRHIYYVIIQDEGGAGRRFVKQVRLVPDKITNLDL